MYIEGLRAVGSETAKRYHFSKDQKKEEVKPRKYNRREEGSKPNPMRGHVIIRYNGTLSGKLEWNTEQLDDFAEASDLRSSVVITSSEDTQRVRDYSAVGEVAVWRSLLNPLNMLSRRVKEDAAIAVEANPSNAEVVLFIKDQELSRKVRDGNNGRFDDDKFAKDLDKITKQGLHTAINWEKSHQAGSTIRNAAITASELGLFVAYESIGMGLIGFSFYSFGMEIPHSISEATRAIHENFPEPERSITKVKPLVDIALTGGGVILGLDIMTKGLKRSADQMHRLVDAIGSLPNRYFFNNSDFFPPKHFKDWVKGSSHLRIKSDIVSLREDSNSDEGWV